MSIITSILKLLEKATNLIPNRIEALKNELDSLEIERSRIYVTKCDVVKAKRLNYINIRIATIMGLLKNSAKD
jgi:hypothetical protein